MQLQFSTRHIAFALSTIWPNLDYKFKYAVNQLITANPDLDYELSPNGLAKGSAGRYLFQILNFSI